MNTISIERADNGYILRLSVGWDALAATELYLTFSELVVRLFRLYSNVDYTDAGMAEMEHRIQEALR